MIDINLCKIGIGEFGPIQGGTQGNLIDIPKCTCFVGPQGSGKSTVAKLISEFSWLEKALVRGEVSEKDLVKKNRFQNKYCQYHRLSSYFRRETWIAYEGEYYHFQYAHGAFSVSRREVEVFDLPKVLYIPAERILVSVTDKTGIIKFLPDALRSFYEEYDNARSNIKAELSLPVDDIVFTYDRLNRNGWIRGDKFRTRLSESASGFQSLAPLFLASWHLSELVMSDMNKTEMEQAVYEKMEREVRAIMTNSDLTEEVRNAALKSLSSRFRYSHFVNVVEEPELNLYPVSQERLLRDLVKLANTHERNRLICTTHSPYILSALNNLMYAAQVGAKHPKEVEKIIPSIYWIQPEKVAAYTTEGGCIQSIIDTEINQIEAERIDNISSGLNTKYEQLLDLDVE